MKTYEFWGWYGPDGICYGWEREEQDVRLRLAKYAPRIIVPELHKVVFQTDSKMVAFGYMG